MNIYQLYISDTITYIFGKYFSRNYRKIQWPSFKVWHGPLERALFMLLFKARINFINYDNIGFYTFDL